ncbi:hypothetical protein KDW_41420 [Dictyobacter vulcani]|uniref:Uncharacterized protein n=1 Tax=Dictyobacter vulcani TaxID=2607529 RepID=A0A5J4KU45_9CHLR|nr:hypothetical protein [Dictyobacter vulcani]GER89980.1 hypothetical protein KDW_41420 [Dictyobacter vulcani]
MYAIIKNIRDFNLPPVIAAILDGISALAEATNILSGANPAFAAIASALTASLHGALAVANGVLSTYNAFMAGASWLKGVGLAVLRAVGVIAEGIPGALFELASNYAAAALVDGGRVVAHSVMMAGNMMLANVQSQQAMDINGWCTQYGKGESACS